MNIEFSLSLDESLLSVFGDAERLSHTVLDLCRNAVEAVGDAGKIKVSTEDVRISEGSNMGVKPGRYVKISVADDGAGVPDDAKDHIFEPFFTTKRSSEREGLGLGLSVANSVARDHGGVVVYKDLGGHGSEFSVYLSRDIHPAGKIGSSIPVQTDHAADETNRSGELPELLHEDTISGSDGGILIVDDEEGIRRLFHTILSSAFPNASIGLAGNGAEAVESLRDTSYAVVLMDLRMPVMDGMTAFSEIQTLCRNNDREMPSVVFCTGFAPPSAVREIVDSDACHCLLTKPVSGEDLVTAVKERLNKRA